jgi:hypothetical protein
MGLARFSVFCGEFRDNVCETQTQKEFWDRSNGAHTTKMICMETIHYLQQDLF